MEMHDRGMRSSVLFLYGHMICAHHILYDPQFVFYAWFDPFASWAVGKMSSLVLIYVLSGSSLWTIVQAMIKRKVKKAHNICWNRQKHTHTHTCLSIGHLIITFSRNMTYSLHIEGLHSMNSPLKSCSDLCQVLLTGPFPAAQPCQA